MYEVSHRFIDWKTHGEYVSYNPSPILVQIAKKIFEFLTTYHPVSNFSMRHMFHPHVNHPLEISGFRIFAQVRDHSKIEGECCSSFIILHSHRHVRVSFHHHNLGGVGLVQNFSPASHYLVGSGLILRVYLIRVSVIVRVIGSSCQWLVQISRVLAEMGYSIYPEAIYTLA